MYTTLRHNYIAKIPKTGVFQAATCGSEAWTLDWTALTRMNAFNSKLWEIAKNSFDRDTKKKSTRGASSVLRTIAWKFCKDTNSETFWSPEMTRRAKGRPNKKKNDKWGEKEEERKKNIKELFGQWAEMQLSYNFNGQSSHLTTPSLLHITYALYSSLFHLSVACGLQTYFRSSRLAHRTGRREATLHPRLNVWRDATTGNTSAVRRLFFPQTWILQIDIAKFSDEKDTGRGVIRTK